MSRDTNKLSYLHINATHLHAVQRSTYAIRFFSTFRASGTESSLWGMSHLGGSAQRGACESDAWQWGQNSGASGLQSEWSGGDWVAPSVDRQWGARDWHAPAIGLDGGKARQLSRAQTLDTDTARIPNEATIFLANSLRGGSAKRTLEMPINPDDDDDAANHHGPFPRAAPRLSCPVCGEGLAGEGILVPAVLAPAMPTAGRDTVLRLCYGCADCSYAFLEAESARLRQQNAFRDYETELFFDIAAAPIFESHSPAPDAAPSSGSSAQNEAANNSGTLTPYPVARASPTTPPYRANQVQRTFVLDPQGSVPTTPNWRDTEDRPLAEPESSRAHHSTATIGPSRPPPPGLRHATVTPRRGGVNPFAWSAPTIADNAVEPPVCADCRTPQLADAVACTRCGEYRCVVCLIVAADSCVFDITVPTPAAPEHCPCLAVMAKEMEPPPLNTPASPNHIASYPQSSSSAAAAPEQQPDQFLRNPYFQWTPSPVPPPVEWCTTRAEREDALFRAMLLRGTVALPNTPATLVIAGVSDPGPPHPTNHRPSDAILESHMLQEQIAHRQAPFHDDGQFSAEQVDGEEEEDVLGDPLDNQENVAHHNGFDPKPKQTTLSSSLSRTTHGDLLR